MSRLQIVHHPHPALSWKSKDVIRIDDQLKAMVAQMFELMYEARGIGLAANQVALPYRLFVINPSGDPELKDEEFVFINPEITRRNGSEESEEGCLSLPEIYGQVPRATRIVVDAFNLQGQQFEMELTGLDARVVQHEYDHLDGILFPSRTSPSVSKELQPLIENLERSFRQRQLLGEIPSDSELTAQLIQLERARTEQR
jgi:peptide deformylase